MDIERIIDRLDTTGDCWLWPGSTNGRGYGEVRHEGRKQYVHRVVYSHLVGPIPEGLVIDHLCRETRCANPQHLEAVSQGENCRRGTAGWNMRVKETCANGHPFDKVYVKRSGKTQRICTVCVAAAGARRDERLRRDRDALQGR